MDLQHLQHEAEQLWGVKPFKFQLDVAEAVLCGEDVIVDIPTGGGKTLCFTLALALNKTEMVLTVSPLSALMIDQVILPCVYLLLY